MEELKKIREVAISASREAGEYAREHIAKIKEVAHKGAHTNLVTDVDKTCEKVIVDKVRKSFPSHSILAEEGGEEKKGGSFTWIIDPLDGTTNYTHGLPIYCVSIAVAESDSVKLGAIYDPSRDELFTAEEGKGAFLNGKRIQASRADKIMDSLIVTGFAYNIKGKIANMEYFKIMLEKAQAVRRLGSAALDLSYVACGRFDGFWELGLSPWDMAAGQLIVKEAGGTVTMLNGDEFDMSKKEVLATNGKIHKEMITLLKNSPPC